MKSALFILAAAALLHAQDTRTVTEPTIPATCATLTAQAADETHLDTQRIQQSMNACAPGKAVVLSAAGPNNTFLSGPLDLRRGVTLVVSAEVTLLASRNPRNYDIEQPGTCGTITEKGHGCRALINGANVADAAVMGDGTIDGQGGAQILNQSISWWDLAEQARKGGNQNNPRLMILSHCDNFTLYRITLKNSPNFHVSYSNGNGFTVWGVKVWSPAKNARNTDGIDPGNSTNVTITQSFIHTGDDQVAIKAGHGAPTTHMTISHNHFYSGHGMSIGSETDGGASAIRVTDLSIDGGDNGIRIKSNSSRGGLVHDILYEDVCIRDTKNPVFMDTHYSFTGPERDKIPVFEDIVLRNVQIEGAGKLTLDGFDAGHPLKMRFDNVIYGDTVKTESKNADIQRTNVRRTISCQAKFVPFPSQQSRNNVVNPQPGDSNPNSDTVPDVYAIEGQFDRIVVLRFKFGTDLLAGLEKMVKQQKIENAVILTAMGSVRGYQVHQVSNRDMPTSDMFVKDPVQPADIVGMSGYVINGRLHPHIMMATPEHAFGGHLEPGTEVYTFAVVTLGVMKPGADFTHLDERNYR